MSDYKHWTGKDAMEELRRNVLKEQEAQLTAERLNCAEEILDELSSGFWLSVFKEHGDRDMGQRVLDYWEKCDKEDL